jgi:hypothetical protein
MKRILSLFLAFVFVAALGITAYADDYASSVTVSGLSAPADGKIPSTVVTVSAGSLDTVEWFLADDREVALAAGETFKAGHKYAAYIYIDPLPALPWQPLIQGNTLYTEVSDVNASVYDEAGKSIKVTGNFLFNGQLMLQVFVTCPGERRDETAPAPAPEPAPAPAPEPAPAPAPEPKPEPAKVRPDFSDVAPTDWFHDWVYGAVDLGLVNGKGKGDDGRDRFDPNGNMTFAEASKLAACLHQLHSTGKVTLQNGDPWYKSYVDYCASNGILAASSENGGITAADVMSRANEAVTRGEFAWIFAHALPESALAGKNTIPDNAIPDVKSGSGYWVSSVYTLYRAGILNGSDDKGTFHPGDNINRAAVSAICVRMIQTEKRVGAPANLNG